MWKTGNQLDTIHEPSIGSSQSKDDDNLVNETNECPKIVHSREEKLTGTDVNAKIIDSIEEGEIKLVQLKITLENKKKREKNEKRAKYTAGAKDWARGLFPSVAACARAHGVDSRILHEGVVKRGGEFRGSWHTSLVLEQHEEEMIVTHVKHMAKIGNGASWNTLRQLL